MMLRPRPARWIEALCPRSAGPRVVAALARSGAVELELRHPHRGELRLAELERGLADYRGRLSRYGRYWRRVELVHGGAAGDTPRPLLARALARLEAWRLAADGLILRLQGLEDERHRLGLWSEVLDALGDSPLELGLLAGAGPCLARLTAILPGPAGGLLPLGPEVLGRVLPMGSGHCLLAVGPATAIDRLLGQVAARGARLLAPLDRLRGAPPAARIAIAERCADLERDIAALYQRLDALALAQGLPAALGDIACLEWFTRRVGVLELVSDRFALVTGWTDAQSPAPLRTALAREDAPALLHCSPPPAGARPPQILDNPPWARPFEVLTRALGVPGADEVDPSALLALIVPLLFGYMFGDLGQGLVLMAAATLLRRRLPLARLVLAGGASAALFGLIFGSVFGLEHLIPPLWLHPLERPLPVLALPLAAGALLLTLGQLLDGLQAAWRGELGDWLRDEVGLLLAYLGVVLVPGWPVMAWLAGTGVLWHLIGAGRRAPGPLGLLAGLGELAERGLRLLVNTLSFARAGAFALAHAGLSAAILALGEAAGSPWAAILILILGNLVVILLEGLVVSIQTTRLVLFELFTRFLRGSGRVFRPLPPPPSLVQGDNG
jgi:V/A-type H+/Na+-transporting ATPase subunit I